MVLTGGSKPELTMGFLIDSGFKALDLAGPHEVLARLEGYLAIAARAAGMVVSDRGLMRAEESFATRPPRALMVAGGWGQSDVSRIVSRFPS